MPTFPASRLTRVAATLAFAGALTAGCADATPTASPADAPGPTATSGRSDSTTARRTTTTTASDDPSDVTSSTDDTEAADAPDACDLLTERDAEEAFGEPVVAGDQRHDECWWSSENDLKTVNLIRRSGDIDTWRRGYQNDQWEKVDRGDEGYAGKALDSIVWRIGETTYEVNVIYSTKGNPDEVVIELADKALSRL
jgi:hypothetical protein